MESDPVNPGPDQIRKKIKQVSFRVLQKELDKAFKVIPANCVHNVRQPIDPNSNRVSSEEAQTLGFCGIDADDPTKWEGRICDRAEDICENFCPRANKEAIREQVERNLSDLDYVARHHRDIAALRWVLGESEEPFKFDDHMGFWDTVKFMLFPTGMVKSFVLRRNRRESEKVVKAFKNGGE